MAKKRSHSKKAAPAAPSAPAAASSSAKAAASPGFKVRATAPGYYDNVRRRDGDVFTIQNGGEFSKKWMERVSPHTPDKTTTGQEVINREHDEVLGQALAKKGATGGANPLGAE